MKGRTMTRRISLALTFAAGCLGAASLGDTTFAGPFGPLRVPGAIPATTGSQELPLVLVQDRGGPGGPSGGNGGGGGGGGGDGLGGATGTTPASAPAAAAARPQPALSPPVTNAVADSVGDAFDRCRTLDSSYQIDCVSQQLKATADRIAGEGAYGPVNRILNDAARDLARIARQDRDTAQPRVSVQHRDQSGIRTYSAVRRDSVARSKAAAARVIEQAQTLLLRSAANSANRRSHFQRIAAAMDSGKVLLRST